MIKSKFVCLALFSLLFSNALAAFDDYKTGGFLSFGAGYHTISGEAIDPITNKSFSASGNGISTSLQVGIGFTNELIIYYSYDSDWSENEDGDMMLVGLYGLGLTYYLTRLAYLKGSYGKTSSSLLNGSSCELNGSGYIVGIGTDIIKHVSIELNYMYHDYKKLSYNDETTTLSESGMSADNQSYSIALRYSWY